MILKQIREWSKWLFPTTIFMLLVYFSIEYPIIRVFLLLLVVGISIHVSANIIKGKRNYDR